MRYKIVLIDEEYGAVDFEEEGPFETEAEAEAAADAKNTSDPELIEGQVWMVREWEEEG